MSPHPSSGRPLALLLPLVLILLALSGCNGRGVQEASYEMLREREYQLCLQQGRTDCRRYEKYEDYQRQRDEALGGR